MNHSSVFPPVSPGRAREVDAAGGVCLGAQMKTAPGGAGNTTEGLPNPMQPERTTPMVDDQQDHAQGKRGIPTTYAGTKFRSRIEARWAATFDLAGWEWVYEPFDGDGYIPDFLIKSDHPLLVEVKPATLESEYREPIPKITKGIGDLWRHDLIILGADINMKGGGAGVLLDFLAGPDDWHASVAHWVNCPWCVSMGIVTDQTSGYMRPCGHDAPKGGDQPNNLAGLWREAGNLVQWRAV